MAKPFLIAYVDAYAFSSLSEDFEADDLIKKLVFLERGISDIVKGKNMRLRVFSDFAFITYDLSKFIEVDNKQNKFICKDSQKVRWGNQGGRP